MSRDDRSNNIVHVINKLTIVRCNLFTYSARVKARTADGIVRVWVRRKQKNGPLHAHCICISLLRSISSYVIGDSLARKFVLLRSTNIDIYGNLLEDDNEDLDIVKNQ